ncbi:hypothetical protein H257_04357 [Aphanomyces astaci]|uniref:Uncharacterized protein n=1 Tax=Aphanomyces astaci TaxID=112090 RepID=W4GXF9_APHAT|nr:hypothetical protein H257_04357 [Aphanomyces astaci]ETV83694.1 hypothetical protein H257_04357 [Aphanomyces astaci]|eukprot:XP_009827124.1 hypothetical protein H257_04357 [Aphanomyces astaci]
MHTYKAQAAGVLGNIRLGDFTILQPTNDLALQSVVDFTGAVHASQDEPVVLESLRPTSGGLRILAVPSLSCQSQGADYANVLDALHANFFATCRPPEDPHWSIIMDHDRGSMAFITWETTSPLNSSVGPTAFHLVVDVQPSRGWSQRRLSSPPPCFVVHSSVTFSLIEKFQAQ